VKLLFLVTEDWYFASHRLQLARAARDAGVDVVVMSHCTNLYPTLIEEGFKVIPWHLSRRSLNPFREINTFLQVVKAYRRERPDLVHHIALKPIIYGGCAARLLGGIPSVNAVAGMGHVFMSTTWQMRLLKPILLAFLRFALDSEKAKAVFQNEENCSFLVDERVVNLQATEIIRGTGVNVNRFIPRPEPTGPPIVLLASRMLWEKGIGEFVEAAGKLRERNVRARFVLVGKPDPENPGSISEAKLRAWASAGLVEWWGHQDDMLKVLTQASVVCLPSAYGEGVPRVLIEAAACGRAIIATDAPGCRDIVRDGQNGLLIPLRNSEMLARAVETLVKDPALRSALGARGREIAVREFSEETVFAQMMAVYRRLLGSRWPSKSSDTRVGEGIASVSSRT
jgi:glycosyltransferase involved in cell wall biosynthesis